MNPLLLCIVTHAEKTLLASFVVLILLCYLHGQDGGAAVMRNLVQGILTIKYVNLKNSRVKIHFFFFFKHKALCLKK